MKLVNLKYCGFYFNSCEVSPSIEQIEHSFGATHPGEFDASRQVYTLRFRGLSFTFPASKAQSEFYTGVGRSKCPGVSPLASLVSLYSGRSSEAPQLPLSCYLGQLYLERCVAINEKALKLYLYTEGASLEPRRESLTREIWLGDSCQTLTWSLGAPHRVFYKSEDKMKIHSPGPNIHRHPHRSDYFFNYFSLGLDVLFDARTHKAKKFVLHTNYPGHYNFNMYHRCEFLLSLPVEPKDSLELSDSQIQVTAYTKWDSISDSLKHSQRPVVLNRASSVNTKNFFGATLCYGYKGIIFEVMPNQHIASVTIYNGGGLEP